MNQGQQGANRAVPAATQAAVQVSANQPADTTPRAERDMSEVAEPYQVGNTWSVRARREGCDVFLSGFESSVAAAKALRYRLAYMGKHAQPHGSGPDQTSVAKAMRSTRSSIRRRSKVRSKRRVAPHPPGARRPPQTTHEQDRWLRPGAGGARDLKVSHVTHDHLQDPVRAPEAAKMAEATIKQEQALLRRLFNQALTGHRTLAMVKRYVNVTAKDVSSMMHGPEPTPQAPVQTRRPPRCAPRTQGRPRTMMEALACLPEAFALRPARVSNARQADCRG